MSALRLLQWLGPWTRQDKSPKGIKLRIIETSTGPLRLYSSKRDHLGPLFLLSGLHPEGPADPRVDRFARVMANAGYIVGAPQLKSMTDCQMSPELCSDAIEAFCHFRKQVEGPVGIFSISASSIAALSIGAHHGSRQYLSSIMLFGGFINWRESLVYALTGKLNNGKTAPIDPLNLPVIFLNLVHLLPHPPTDLVGFRAALKSFIDQCWEKKNYKTIEQYGPVATDIADKLPATDRMLFFQATRLKEGGVDMAVETAEKEHREHEWLDPGPLLAQQRSPLIMVHGKDDVVVPWTQARELQFAVPEDVHTQRYITGFYDHTGVTGIWRLVRLIPLLPIELWRSIRLVCSMSRLNTTDH